MLRTQHNKSSVLTLTLVCLLGWATDAHAYFDPGTGSMLIQLLMASVLGFIFTLKIYWGKFKGFLKNLVGKCSPNDSKN